MIDRRRAWAVTGAVLGWSAAQTPGALPRTTLLSAVVATALALVGMLVGLLAARASGGSHTPDSDAPASRAAASRAAASRLPLIIVSAVGAGSLALSCWWQAGLRAAMGMPPIGPAWLAATVVIPAAAVAALLWMPLRRTVIAAAAGGLIVLGGPAVPAQAAAPDVPDSPLLHYAQLDGRDDATRAAGLVADWGRTGGLDREAVVIAVPTGSGWVDGAAVEGARLRFGGSVRVLAMQYNAVPSWQAYLRSPDRAGESATTLLAEVSRAVRSVAPDRRPQVYLYGQSLGATGAEAARDWAVIRRIELAGTVLAGLPGGRDATRVPHRTVLNNASDPVAALTPSLLWRPPPAHSGAGQSGERHSGAGYSSAGHPSPQPPWIPGLSLLATVVDLAGSLDVPSGYGHRYGAEQGLELGTDPSTDGPSSQPSTGPRAAS
ncbi:alpha/beta-hydrolase family protein [Gordonia caeni]|uniref:Alpha/beta-hydrolase catalytic domain-containing protein n=1 Tax=Gordonia caeni TaxID=1007097 RepID=A0ABP7NZG4_9ACTN